MEIKASLKNEKKKLNQEGFNVKLIVIKEFHKGKILTAFYCFV